MPYLIYYDHSQHRDDDEAMDVERDQSFGRRLVLSRQYFFRPIHDLESDQKSLNPRNAPPLHLLVLAATAVSPSPEPKPIPTSLPRCTSYGIPDRSATITEEEEENDDEKEEGKKMEEIDMIETRTTWATSFLSVDCTTDGVRFLRTQKETPIPTAQNLDPFLRPLALQDVDVVISGNHAQRGGGSDRSGSCGKIIRHWQHRHPGNRYFYTLVKKYRSMYLDAYKLQSTKRNDIIFDIMQHIRKRGGRFLHRRRSNMSNNGYGGSCRNKYSFHHRRHHHNNLDWIEIGSQRMYETIKHALLEGVSTNQRMCPNPRGYCNNGHKL